MTKKALYITAVAILTITYGVCAQSTPYYVQWTDLVGSQVNSNTLSQAGPTGWGNSGAASENVIDAGVDGWVEFKAITGVSAMLGLSNSNVNSHYNTINYAFYINSSSLVIYENGFNKQSLGACSTGESLRIRRSGTTIEYVRNGLVVYTSTVSSTSQLVVDVAFNSSGSRFEDVLISHGTLGQQPASISYDIAWTDIVGATVVGNTLTKTAIGGYNNSGAASINVLNPNTDGWIEYTIDELTGERFFGFSDLNLDPGHVSIDYCVSTYSDGRIAIRLNNVIMSTPSVSVGDVIRLERSGTSIHVKRNGSIVYTFTDVYTGSLIADASLYWPGNAIVNAKASFWIPYQQGEIPDQWEFNALKDIYESLGGSNWTYKTNWPTVGNWPATATASQMGTWQRVTVANGDISSLQLHSNNLVGEIPGSIGDLRKLTILYLYGNQLTGAIPSSIGLLTKLDYLYLHSNQLSDNIPSTLNQLNKLRYLKLNNNRFSGNIPDLSGLTSLINFDLGGNTYLTPGPIPSWFSALENLQLLSLPNTNRTGSIPAYLGNISSLRYLYLNSNQLTGSIPVELGNLSSLIHLYLYTNQLSGQIPYSLSNIPNLQYLYLMANQFSGPIPDWLGSIGSLLYLNLSNNQFSGSIPESLGNLSNLTHLYLNNNKLSGVLPSSLGGLSNLIYLHIYSNQITGELPSEWSGMTNLQYFQANANRLTGGVPSSYGALTKMRTFYLNSNQLSGDLPQEIGSWPLLTIFNVSYNKFKSLPSTIKNNPILNNLNLYSNELVDIPSFADFSNKANLTLDVRYNRLDFADLEPNTGVGIKTFYIVNQNPVSDLSKKSFVSALTIPARMKTANTAVVWEKQNGAGWTNVTASNEDATQQTFYKANPTSSDEGVYRWKATNTVVTGITIQSDPITVKEAKVLALDNWAFQYKYDDRNRITHKKVPGADWIYMVYDDRDRLVMTQDGEQRKLNKWSFTKYDALNRPIITGIYTHTATVDQAGMKALISNVNFFETYNGSANFHGYSNTVFPIDLARLDILTVTYYDRYDFKTTWGSEYDYLPNQVASKTVNGVLYSQPATAFMDLKGQVTGTKTRILGSFPFWIQTVNYFDDRYRVVQVVSDGYLASLERHTTLYDFVGKALSQKASLHKNKITWQNVERTDLKPEGLVKQPGVSTWNAGASSVQYLGVNEDGWAEVTVTEVSTGKAWGLSDSDTDLDHGSIDYGFRFSYGTLYVQENGVGKLTTSGAVGDKLRIVRTGGVIRYYRNNSLLYTSTTPSVSQLLVDISFFQSNASFGSPTGSFIRTINESTTRTFDYDHAGRLVNTWHQVDGGEQVLLVHNEYNELGQLVDKKLHSTDNGVSFKQSVDYRYNIKGWLTSLNNADLNPNPANNDDNNDLFGMELAYNEALGTGNANLFNGNISGMKWSNNQGVGDVKANAYNYGYDPMNRLKSANFHRLTGVWEQESAYGVSGISYDLNGNIMSLTRKGKNGSDQDLLTYDYGANETRGNQLRWVSDAGDALKGFADGNLSGDDYFYDANGNMTIDKNKNITAITYNHLNLPEKVTKGTGEYIKYTYDATGKKLSQQVYAANNALKKSTDYVGEYIYENDTLRFANTEEGRVIPVGESQSPNLISNPEGTSLTDFQPYASATLSIEQLNGNSYIKVQNALNNTAPGIWRRNIPVTGGQHYRFVIEGYSVSVASTLFTNYNGETTSYWGPPLPIGQSNEAIVIYEFTVPTGKTSLSIGVRFGNTPVGSTMYLNSFNLYQVTEPSYEYQYHLKDHLGNVRLTFTTKDEQEAHKATLETAKANDERSQFLYYDDVRLVNSILFDKTKDGQGTPPEGAYALRLNGSANEQTGLAKSLAVVPGDVVQLEVYAKYVDPNSSNWTAALTNLLTSVANGTAVPGTVIDGAGYAYGGTNVFPFGGLLDKSSDPGTGPKAYLNYLVFDQDYMPILSKSGYKRLSDQPKENGSNVLHEKLDWEITITEAGYVYIWLSNEEVALGGSEIEVYFDDFKVTHIKSPVIEEQFYYPFGMIARNYNREDALPNQYKFNSKEFQDEFNLGWLDFGARMYMPDIGRWTGLDVLADNYYDYSPYNYALNNPLIFIDPDGREVDDCPGCKERVVGKPEQQVSITSITANLNKKGKLVSVTVGFSVKTTKNIEVVDEASGKVVESRTDVVTSGGSVTLDPQGTAQVNKNTGEPFGASGDIVLAGTKGIKSSTIHHSDIRPNREGNPRSEAVDVGPTRVNFSNAKILSKTVGDYSKGITPDGVEKYWSFILEKPDGNNRNLNATSHGNSNVRDERQRKRRDSITHHMDSLLRLHKRQKGN